MILAFFKKIEIINIIKGMKLLNEDNFFNYCKDNYKNEHCMSEKEFFNDCNIPKFIKTLFRKHVCGKTINYKMLINHFKILFNLFGEEAGLNIIFYRIEDYYYPQLKSCLLFMDKLPPSFYNYQQKLIFMSDILIDDKLYNKIKQTHK